MSSPPLPAESTVPFPRLSARTMRFTLGIPNHVSVSPDGERVLFLRSRSGTERDGLLWLFDVATGQERLLADPRALLVGADESLPAAELARRERMRQGGAGITAYSTDASAEKVAVTLSGRVFVVTVASADVVEVPTPDAAVDPRLSPDGRWVALHCAGGLFVAPTDAPEPARALVEPDGEQVTWGLSDFVHAEELDRHRSFWWAPDSTGLLVTRVDESPVPVRYISDPAHPDREPTAVRYPVVGGPNPATTLWHVHLDGTRTEVGWDHSGYEYLVGVTWPTGRPALVSVLDRALREMVVLGYEPASAPEEVRRITDDAWVDVVPGAPTWWGDRLLTVERDVGSDTFALMADGETLSPPGLQVRAVLDVDDEAVLLSVAEDDRERRVGRLHAGGRWEWLSAARCVATGRTAGRTTVVRTDSLESTEPSVVVSAGGADHRLRCQMVRPPMLPRPRFLRRTRPDDPRAAVLLPTQAPDGPLPVLLDPYGGPHGQRVFDSARAFLESQWWADQGFAVVVADGPGMPGAPAWERAMSGRLAEPALAAQVRALEMLADELGEAVDLTRVAIRGWSFGGYLAALTVLERPDLVRAAVAGAPVTDFRYYDTVYTERFLGLPSEHPDTYENTSLLPRAAKLERPLLIIHGLADDNVLVANTLALSSALLAAGRPHQVLPLSGVTHMTPQEVVAENLLLAQRHFLAEALA